MEHGIRRGVEVLIKKAAVDPAFKRLLFEKRAEAARAIGLELTPEEAALLAAAPLPQLEAIVTRTCVSPGVRPAFLGYAAGAMLAALGPAFLACDNPTDETFGLRPDPPPENQPGTAEESIMGPVDSVKEKPPLTDSNDAGRESIGGLCFGIRGDFPPGIQSEPRKPIIVESLPTLIIGPGAGDPKRSAKVIGTVFERHLPGIENVYRKNPSIKHGTVELEITIDSDGLVTAGNITSDGIGDEFLNSTILTRVRTWRFPPIEEGDVTVTYPFIFEPVDE
ncbi:MAG: TonB family protein [Candidatus Zixiibacteriota bacterium]|jgi:TonB family protein